ncbi:EI24 domain-containing protein [Streptomyces sp. LX-29]|uniref:EI24 domain-containing protein n=1 Tax=Streptomyces sp. LX-29 TaxID=2900152 RepID=UPI00240DF9ED|nr:EI24 domain-containing protein [Streptomyces sp. LX-29]WFB09744.1 EI24 domain-containing protein [Streptomyces sp. LX-29]
MRDLVAGFGYLMKGQRWVARHGRWWGIGMLPALVTLVGYAAALVCVAFWTDDVVAWATPFADDWANPWLGLFRGALAGLFVAACLLLAILTFTAVTLLVGQPFYESLSEEVDRSVGGFAPESGLPLWRELLISARESLAVLLRAALWGVLLFALGFVPVIGQTVIPAIGFCVSGFFLAEELTAVALARRRVPLKERLQLLRGRRMLTLGFGVPLTLLFLIPLVSVFLMPGAVAGATLLARDLTGEDEVAPDGGAFAGHAADVAPTPHAPSGYAS